MKQEPFKSIGKVIKIHGYKGSVTAFIDKDYQELFRSSKTVFIDFETGTLIPYCLDKIAIGTKNRFYLDFSEVKSETESKKLVGKKILLPSSEIDDYYGEEDTEIALLNYAVQDENHGIIGLIVDLVEYPQQTIMVINSPEGKEILIPMNDEFIIEIHKEDKTIKTKLPNGLIDLYLDK